MHHQVSSTPEEHKSCVSLCNLIAPKKAMFPSSKTIFLLITFKKKIKSLIRTFPLPASYALVSALSAQLYHCAEQIQV